MGMPSNQPPLEFAIVKLKYEIIKLGSLMNSLFAKSTKRHRPRRVQIRVRDGRFEIVGLNVWHSHWRDPYHLILTIPWQGFTALVVGTYFGANVLFALLYLAGGDCVANAAPGSFWDRFFFSVQTFGSILLLETLRERLRYHVSQDSLCQLDGDDRVDVELNWDCDVNWVSICAIFQPDRTRGI
jgi:hypothetical protein